MEVNFNELTNVQLDDILSVTKIGKWDWQISTGKMLYSVAWAELLGYTVAELPPTMASWKDMIVPEDLVYANEQLEKCLTGETAIYEATFRMKCKDGSIIWVQDRGKIVEYDESAKPVHFVGAMQDISHLKNIEKQLAATLCQLETQHQSLENEIANRTKLLTEQGNMLWAVNDVSKQLFSINSLANIDETLLAALKIYGNASGSERIALWKNETIGNKLFCSLIYKWTSEHKEKFSIFEKNHLFRQNKLLELLKESEYILSSREQDILFHSTGCEKVSYEEQIPTFYKKFLAGKSINCPTSDLTPLESFYMHTLGIKSILATPIYLNDEIWGFIIADNFTTEKYFSEVEEKLLSIVGFFLANFIQKVETEKKIREAEERIQLMLNATPLCCNLWNKNFHNMSCNDEAVRLFELSSQQEYLDRFFELSPEYQPNGKLSSEMAAEYITTAFNEGYCRFEWYHRKLDGTPIPAEVTLVRIKYKDDYIVAGYTRDLRELKTTLELQAKEQALRAARDQALQNSKAKSNFLANMSHEIRTPMNAISGLAEVILRESEGNQSAEYALGIKTACNNLLNIINGILDISKIESGKLEIVNSPYALAALLSEVITIFRMRLGKKPLMFITDIDSKLPAQLVGDAIRVKQILINILSNAIKFTQEGHIALRVWGDMYENKITLHFSVTDTGFGIKPEDLDSLFKEFERVNTTKNRQIEGTGLGLAISKQLSEMMGGSIKVESIYGKGSVFTVTIPQECPNYERLATVSTTKSILLYEPRELYLNSIRESIENLDCNCIFCTRQSEFCDNIKLIPYDYILTSSIHLKKVQRLLKQNNLETPVAIFADYYESLDDDSIYTLLFPINCLQIADMLNGEKKYCEYNTRTSKNDNFIAPTAQILVVDDNPVNLQVAIGLMTPYKFVIDTAENGIEAIEKIKTKKYDLVFMDHMMPEMDGIDATIAIRQLEDKYYHSLPIVALTANALVGTREMFIREGMNDFLAKPIEISNLNSILAKWIPNSKKIQSTPDKIIKTVPPIVSGEIAGIDMAQGIISVGGNKEHYLQILASYYRDTIKKYSSLAQHLINNDILTFRTEVHALKSTSATIGAMDLSAMAAKLELASQKGDIKLIDRHIDEFLITIKKVLDTIRPFVNSYYSSKKSKDNSSASANGDLNVLLNTIDSLYEAVELANIKKTEDIISKLMIFSWSAAITKELVAIKEHLAIFDYDAALECVCKIKILIKK